VTIKQNYRPLITFQVRLVYTVVAFYFLSSSP